MFKRQLMLVLALPLLVNTAFAQTTHIGSAQSIQTSVIEKARSVFLSKEEKFYIHSNCKQFAVDDKIEEQFVKDYITVCSQELTYAVQVAKLKKQQKSRTKQPANKPHSSGTMAL